MESNNFNFVFPALSKSYLCVLCTGERGEQVFPGGQAMLSLTISLARIHTDETMYFDIWRRCLESTGGPDEANIYSLFS